MNDKLGREVAPGNEQDSLRDLSALTPELSRSLLVWWEMKVRLDPEQKPWMLTVDQTWPLPEDCLSTCRIWIAEVMLCSLALIFRNRSYGWIPSMAMAYY